MTLLHINRPRYIEVKQPAIFCTTCQARRRQLCTLEAWYGVYRTCLTCGERWGDGERLERPFARGWRQDSVRRAKELWARYGRVQLTKRALLGIGG